MQTHHNIKILRWFNFFTDFKLYAPIAILYFSQVTDSYALGMSVFSIVMISSALFEIPTGIFSDRIGRRQTMILGAAAAIAFTTFYAIGQSFWILAIGAIFEGLSRSFYSGTDEALIHDTLFENQSEHNFANTLGKLRSMFQVGLSISAIVGSLLATWSLPLIMWLSIIPQALCLILAFKLVEPKIHTKQSGNIYQHLTAAYKNFIANKKLRLLSLSHIIGYSFGEPGWQFQAAIYSAFWPVWAIGLIKAASSVLASVTSYFSGPLIKRFGGIQILMISNIYNRAANIIATLFPSLFTPLLISSGSGFFGVVNVARNSLLQKEFTNEQRATMGSLNAFAGSFVLGIVAFLLGLVADILSPTQAFLLLNVAQLANIWIYIKLFKHHK